MSPEAAVTTLARMAEVMAQQQHEMRQLLQHQQEVLEKMKPHTSTERRVEGISMPTYFGKIGESLQVFLQQVQLYFSAKNIDVNAADNQSRLVAMVATNLKGQAAAWYTFHQGKFSTLNALAEGLQAEFVPPDLQERLRADLFKLKQIQCTSLEDYVAKFRQVICQVRDMSDIDQITWFVHGLVTRTREEVSYRRCSTVSKAIAVALEFERAHANVRGDRGGFRPRRDDRSIDTAVPMEIDNVHVREISRDECRRRNLCFRCKRPGHRMNDCRVNTSFRKNGRFEKSDHRSVNAVEFTPPSLVDSNSQDPMTFRNYSVNMVMVHAPRASDAEHKLIRKEVEVNGHTVLALIDCGADHNLVRPGLVEGPGERHVASVESFDGTVKRNVELREVTTDIVMDDFVYKGISFTEYDLPPSHDMILGKPWLTRFNPSINWRTHAIKVPLSFTSFPDLRAAYRYTPLTEKWAKLHVFPGTSDYTLYHVKVSAVVEKTQYPDELDELLVEYGDVFPDTLPTGLPPERRVEFELNMKPDARPSSRAPFRLSKTEQEALQTFVDDLLHKQWIEVSDSPWVSNVFGVPKRDPATGKLMSRGEWLRSGSTASPIRWVVDYRYLNSQTLIPKIPLPNIEELFDEMAGAVVFSVIDLAQGYHQMRVKPSSRPYTAFRSATETYHWCVAPMGVAGMPGIWSRLMRVLLGKFPFVVVYLDDICIYSKSMQQHLQQLRAVFDVLRGEKLYARLEKCAFAQNSVNFLGHTISQHGLQVDQSKTAAIEQWNTPTTVKELQSFLGLAGYYRRFIHRFADIVLPLSDLVKKDRLWQWTSYQENAFLVIKAALQQAPILRLPNFDEVFVVTTDASRQCCGGVLSQRHEGFDHPVAFYSKKLGKHELNWPAHEKELYAIKLALAKWRHYLHGRRFLVYTDNIACRWFLHHPSVSAKLARWLDFFSQFDFELHHVKGVQNIVADALSRHVPEDDVTSPAHPVMQPTADATEGPPSENEIHIAAIRFHTCSEVCLDAQSLIGERQCVMNELASRSSYDLHLLLDDQSRGESIVRRPELIQENVQVNASSTTRHVTTIALSQDVRSRFMAGYRADPAYASITSEIPQHGADGVLYGRSGLVYRQCEGRVDTLCVPSDYRLRTMLLAEFHDGSAHPGVPRTLAKLAQWYYWKEIERDVKDYVQSCLTCLKFKVSSSKKKGKLIPLEIPSECWQHVGVDYITGLPTSNGYDCIQVVVDLLSKRAKYAAMHSTADAADCARVFFDSVVRHHGLPEVVVSDRDSRFTAAFWQELMRIMGVQLRMTTAHRAQADGQVERQNRVLEDALRCMTSMHGSDWSELLGTIEFAHATLVSASTGLTPFEIDCGRKARHPGSSTSDQSPNGGHTKAEFARQFAERRREIVERAQQALLDAKKKQKQYYDKRRGEPDFKSGDQVLLKTENLSFKQVAQSTELTKAKLAARLVGPFTIDYMVNENVARLKLPKRLRRIHPSFNVDLLTAYPEQHDRFRSRPKYKATPVEQPDQDDDDGMRIVEKLLAIRQFNRKTEYLVKWLGEPISESTWELEKSIKHVVHWKRLLSELRDQQRAKRNSSRGDCQPQASSFMTGATHDEDEQRDQARATRDSRVDDSSTARRRTATKSQARVAEYRDTTRVLQPADREPRITRSSRRRRATPRRNQKA